MAAKPKASYKCTECGWQTSKWVGRCSECQAWGTVVEASTKTGLVSPLNITRPTFAAAAKAITELDTSSSAAHQSSGISEFDRVLGGGVVPGAVILLSGEPGIGKSTLLLSVAAKVAARGEKVLYLSGEESVSQIRLRAERTGNLEANLFLAAENDLELALGQVEQTDPGFLIVDSVQTLFNPNIEGFAGGVSQVREVAAAVIKAAKSRNMPVILVGHVTKEGSLAGPRLLEHLVDVVLHFEGDKQTGLRFIRSLKNRYGATDEIGCFEMTGAGIVEVPDPSGLFLSRSTGVSGSCVTIALEGRRCIPVEIQALVVPSSSPQPRRVVSGLESSRVAMILAVLERRLGLKLGALDVYVSTVGGMKLSEPAADLAIALAVASAVSDKPLDTSVAAFGEISLAGEVRRVSSAKQRRSEAARLGLERSLDAESHASLREAVNAALPRSEG